MNSAAIAIGLHALSAVVWVGGMFFAYHVLRPVATTQFEPPQRLQLWSAVFSRFFPWVWLFVILLPASGYWLIFAAFGGMSAVGLHVHLMQLLGWIMILLFLHLYFAPFRRLKESIITQEWQAAGRQLNRIRRVIGVNLILGLVVVVSATAGRYL